MIYKRLSGIVTATVTPLDKDDQLNMQALSKLTHFLIEKGIHGLFPCGSTGEGVLLTTEERKKVAEITVKETAARIPVVIHTGSIHLNGPWFSGNFLSPGNIQGPLYITFSQPVNNISLSFATADANQNEDGTFLELVAYAGAVGSNPVGSVNGNAHYGSGGAGATYPEGTLTLSSAIDFTSVMLHLLPNQPGPSSPPAAAFFVDNVVVNVVPEPASLAGFAMVSLLVLRGRRR